MTENPSLASNPPASSIFISTSDLGIIELETVKKIEPHGNKFVYTGLQPNSDIPVTVIGYELKDKRRKKGAKKLK